MKKLLLLLSICVFVLSNSSNAQPVWTSPHVFSFQSVLIDTLPPGHVADGLYVLRFSMYAMPDTECGGPCSTLLGTQTLTRVQVTNGVFSVELSADSLPLPCPGCPAYVDRRSIEVTVMSGPGIASPITFTPRSLITSAPFALYSDTAQFAETGQLSKHAITADTAIYAKAAPPGGTAGGDLSGIFPNPSIKPGINLNLNGLNVCGCRWNDSSGILWTGKKFIYGNSSSVKMDLNGINIKAGDDVPWLHWANKQFIYGDSSSVKMDINGINLIDPSVAIEPEDTCTRCPASIKINNMPFIHANYNTYIGLGAGSYSSGMSANIGGINTGGTNNVALGSHALNSITTGSDNIGIGYNALKKMADGSENIGIGLNALLNATSSANNIVLGNNSLINNTGGAYNIAIGNQSLGSNTGGYNNIAIGQNSLSVNTSSGDNIAIGTWALGGNTGGGNIGIGTNALSNASSGNGSIGIGYGAIQNNQVDNSTAIGSSSLQNNTTGVHNTAIGGGTLLQNTTGGDNTAVGYFSLTNSRGSNNTGLGSQALKNTTTGNRNVGVGLNTLYLTDTAGSNTAVGTEAGYNAKGSGNIFIGNKAGYNETGSNKLYINNSEGTPLVYGDFSSKFLGLNQTAPTSTLDISATTGYNQLRLRLSYTPTSHSDAHGNTGDVTWDTAYVYVKTPSGWKRAALTSW